MSGSELYAWTQREMACLIEKLHTKEISWKEYSEGRKKIDQAWKRFHGLKSLDAKERSAGRPSAREYTDHYEKSFTLSDKKVQSQ